MYRIQLRTITCIAILLATLLIQAALCGCKKEPTTVIPPQNHAPVLDSLIAYPDTIGPSDSTVVVCYARDPDGDSLAYDWLTDARLRIKGNPDWKNYLNQQRVPSLTFYNANLSNPINDSAWVYCSARDLRGGAAPRRIFIILRSQ